MSSHADTIRAALRHTTALPDPCEGCLAEDSLDALLAENQQLRDALEYALAQVPMYSDHAHVLRGALAGDAE